MNYLLYRPIFGCFYDYMTAYKLKASVEEEVNVHRSETEKNAFKVVKLKQLVSCLILTLSIQEKDRWVWFSTLNLRIYFYIAFIL